MSASPDEVRRELDPLMLEFGVTVFFCQDLEWHLQFLLSMLAEYVVGGSGSDVPEQIEFHSGKTFGGLVKALEKLVNLPADFATSLEKCRLTRNRVIHGYLAGRNMTRFVDPVHRLMVIEELKGIREELGRVTSEGSAMINVLASKFGVSQEQIAQMGENLWRQSNPDPSSASKH